MKLVNKKQFSIHICILALVLLSFTSCKQKDTIATPEKAYCPIQIGVVMDKKGFNDHSYNEYVWQGVKRYANSIRLSSSCYKYFESSDENEAQEFIKKFADEHDIVITSSPKLSPLVEEIYEQYKKVTFVIIDNFIEAENVISLTYDYQYMSFLAGYLAGSLTVENGAYYHGENEVIAASFEQGIHSFNEKVNVKFDFDDAPMVESYDVIFQEDNKVTSDYTSITFDVNDSDNKIVFKKEICDDIYEIIRLRSRNELKSGRYDSKNFSVPSSYSGIIYLGKQLIHTPDFEYASNVSYRTQEEMHVD